MMSLRIKAELRLFRLTIKKDIIRNLIVIYFRNAELKTKIKASYFINIFLNLEYLIS